MIAYGTILRIPFSTSSAVAWVGAGAGAQGHDQDMQDGAKDDGARCIYSVINRNKIVES